MLHQPLLHVDISSTAVCAALMCLFNSSLYCLWICIFTLVCSVPGRVCPTALVLPLDLSLLQHIVLPLDMSFQHRTMLPLKSKHSGPTSAYAACGLVCPTNACPADGRVWTRVRPFRLKIFFASKRIVRFACSL